jgi:hypothetical protein
MPPIAVPAMNAPINPNLFMWSSVSLSHHIPSLTVGVVARCDLAVTRSLPLAVVI